MGTAGTLLHMGVREVKANADVCRCSRAGTVGPMVARLPPPQLAAARTGRAWMLSGLQRSGRPFRFPQTPQTVIGRPPSCGSLRNRRSFQDLPERTSKTTRCADSAPLRSMYALAWRKPSEMTLSSPRPGRATLHSIT